MATLLQIAPYLGPFPEWSDTNLFSPDQNPLPVFSKDITTLTTSASSVNEVRRGGSGILFTYSGTTYVISELEALRYFLGDRAKYKWRVINSTNNTLLAGPNTFIFYRSTHSVISAEASANPSLMEKPAPLSYDLYELKVISSKPWKK